MDSHKDINQKFHKDSYQRHADWYNKNLPSYEQKIQTLNSIKDYKGSINHWLQDVFFNCLTPLIEDKKNIWLTIGDAYGHDAKYLLDNGIKNVTATDLNDELLKIANEIELINQYKIENAENLSFMDNTYDFILCKESYHHFPRPYAALYEMIRVARKGIVIIEPQDPISKMPMLLLFHNILEKLKVGWINRFWKNRFSYEPVGNYVYKVSEREFEKFAAALNLPLIAIKPINPNYWFPGSNKLPASISEKKFRKILLKKKLRDTLCKLGIIPSQTLSIIVFKNLPNNKLILSLKSDGYKIITIPQNPYL